MKTGIHPTWFANATVTCACGNKFTTGSTQDAIRVEICSKCHPLFTGQQKFVDTQGRVEKFQSKSKISEAKKEQKKTIIEARSKKTEQPKEKLSLRDLLMQARKATS